MIDEPLRLFFYLLNVYFRWPSLKGVAIPLTRAMG